MKAIAIVNLPFDDDLNKEDAYFAMRDGKYCQRVCLRPLPQKRINKDCLVVHEIWNEGWNACIDEIMGETK